MHQLGGDVLQVFGRHVALAGKKVGKVVHVGHPELSPRYLDHQHGIPRARRGGNGESSDGLPAPFGHADGQAGERALGPLPAHPDLVRHAPAPHALVQRVGELQPGLPQAVVPGLGDGGGRIGEPVLGIHVGIRVQVQEDVGPGLDGLPGLDIPQVLLVEKPPVLLAHGNDGVDPPGLLHDPLQILGMPPLGVEQLHEPPGGRLLAKAAHVCRHALDRRHGGLVPHLVLVRVRLNQHGPLGGGVVQLRVGREARTCRPQVGGGTPGQLGPRPLQLLLVIPPVLAPDGLAHGLVPEVNPSHRNYAGSEGVGGPLGEFQVLPAPALERLVEASQPEEMLRANEEATTTEIFAHFGTLEGHVHRIPAQPRPGIGIPQAQDLGEGFHYVGVLGNLLQNFPERKNHVGVVHPEPLPQRTPFPQFPHHAVYQLPLVPHPAAFHAYHVPHEIQTMVVGAQPQDHLQVGNVLQAHKDFVRSAHAGGLRILGERDDNRNVFC